MRRNISKKNVVIRCSNYTYLFIVIYFFLFQDARFQQELVNTITQYSIFPRI